MSTKFKLASDRSLILLSQLAYPKSYFTKHLTMFHLFLCYIRKAFQSNKYIRHIPKGDSVEKIGEDELFESALLGG